MQRVAVLVAMVGNTQNPNLQGYLIMRSDNNRFTLALMLVISLYLPNAHAAFTLNFKTSPNHIDTDQYQGHCGGFDGRANSGCDWSMRWASDGVFTDDTRTQWLQEDTLIGGERYWHSVVIDPANGFRQDAYTRMGFVASATGLSDSGGVGGFGGAGFPENRTFAATGVGRYQLSCEAYMGNGCDPLGKLDTTSTHRGDNTWTGSGTGNPTRTVFRQTLDANGFYQEVLKDDLAHKAKMTQILDEGGLRSEWEADMRNSLYNDMNSPLTAVSTLGSGPGTFVNKLVFTPTVDAVYGNTPDFDMAMTTAQNNPTPGMVGPQSGKSDVTAGRFIYTPGNGWLPRDYSAPDTYFNTYYLGRSYTNIAQDGSIFTANPIPAGGSDGIRLYDAGTYSYLYGGFDQHAVDYSRYMDAAQNPCGGRPFC